MNQPDHTELEQAILQYLGSQPPSEGREGTLYVKVTDLERVTDPPDSNQFRGGLFLSVRFVGADRTKLEQALARVRKGSSGTRSCPDGTSRWLRRRRTPIATRSWAARLF